ncbi:MAG: crotonase/enoyl-CoA hydratase family protein [Myxococcota bacterium]
MADDKVHYSLENQTAVIHMDDGRVNGLSPDMLAAIDAQLTRAEKEAAAVVLVGREGRFSAGFDLSTMGAGREAAGAMVAAGAELLVRMAEFPIPLVAACSGHAIAAGALLLLASDLRVGTKGDFKIGLNEVTIGMTLPVFALELARERLSKRHYTRATQLAEIYAPEGAIDAGFLDELAAPEALRETACAAAERLASLQQPAFRATKQRNAAAMTARVRASLDEDFGALARRSGT